MLHGNSPDKKDDVWFDVYSIYWFDGFRDFHRKSVFVKVGPSLCKYSLNVTSAASYNQHVKPKTV